MPAGNAIDFSSVGGQPVTTPPPASSGGIDFSSVGGRPVSGAVSTQADQTTQLNSQLHDAYDKRPLWRKLLGFEPDPSTLSPELQQHLANQKQVATQSIGQQLQEHVAAMGQGAKMGAMAIPFMALGPAGSAVSTALGGGVVGTLGSAALQGLGSAAISSQEGATPTGAAVSGVLGAAGPLVSPALGAAGKYVSSKAPGLYQTALKASTRLPLGQTEQAVQTGLQEGIPVSKTGLDKISGLIDDLNDKIANEISAKPGVTIPSGAVAQRVGQIKPTFELQANPRADVAALENARQEFLEAHGGVAPGTPAAPTGLLDQYGKPIMSAGTPPTPPQPIPATTAQAIKQGTYRQLKYGELSAATEEGQKALARGIKEELATQFPELNNLNQRESRLFNLQPLIEQAVKRSANNQTVGIGAPMLGTGIKAATGSTGLAGVAAAMKTIVDQPAVKSRLAIVLSRAGGIAFPEAMSRIVGFSTALGRAAAASNTAVPGGTLPPQTNQPTP